MRENNNLLFPNFNKDKRQIKVSYNLVNEMENKRSFGRFKTQLKAQYFLDEKKGVGEECTITDISRRGMGIRFHTRDSINIDSTIFLEIFVPERKEPINVKGVLKQVNWRESDFFGGIEWDHVNGCIR